MASKNAGVVTAGLALFSMFFGAGDLIWPLILGGQAGDHNLSALLGLLISGVSLPLLGLVAMMLFRGDYYAFFGQIGRIPGIILIFIIQAILGPFGSTPRLISLSHATLKPYLPDGISLLTFSACACLVVFFFTCKKSRVVDLLGMLLCPVLLVALGLLVGVGMYHPPAPEAMNISSQGAFFSGLNVGYNTLDLIASFIFAPLVLSYFCKGDSDYATPESRRHVFGKMLKASLIAGGLLAAMYIGLTYVASYYTPLLPPHHPEERLGAISVYLLGTKGAFFSCMAVALSCLTTAIPITVITADYIHKNFMKGKGSYYLALMISLVLAMVVSNLGFMGIASMLAPILQIICPGLIILSVFNILYKLYEMQIRRSPVYAAFALSIAAYFIW